MLFFATSGHDNKADRKIRFKKNVQITRIMLLYRLTEEHRIQNEIRCAVSPYCTVFRVNVGEGRTVDGRYFTTGVPKGFSDLFGVRHKDGRAVFIEVKTKSGRVRPEQKKFITKMRECGALAGICRSAEDAVNLLTEE